MADENRENILNARDIKKALICFYVILFGLCFVFKIGYLITDMVTDKLLAKNEL